MKKSVIFILAISAIVLYSCNTTQVKQDNIYDFACNSEEKPKTEKSPWHISNLYSCQKNEWFIPYQLWSGAKWDGNKNTSCMHEADTVFYVNGTSRTTIKGPKKWANPKTQNEIEVWFREKTNGSKQQYFTCNEKGIGREYDNRRGGRYYSQGRCKFPAGYGWKVGKQRKCLDTAIEITKLELDSKSNLSGIEFKWWYKNSNGSYIHDHTYRYEPNVGSVNAWKQ